MKTLTESDIKQWVQTYNTQNKLPSTQVPCSTCGAGTTLSHDNLHRRVVKYGCIDTLLRTFKCRDCRSSTPSQKALSTGVDHTEIKSYIYTPKPPTTVNLLEDKEEAFKLTATECLRPDLYLDNNRSCSACSLTSVCACRLNSSNKSITTTLVRRK